MTESNSCFIDLLRRGKSLWRHGACIETIESAKTAFSLDEERIDSLKHLGLVDEGRLREISEDAAKQESFRDLMIAIRDGGSDALKARDELINLPPDIEAGWLRFRRKFYEEMWGINLLQEGLD
jgi:hypothetical protein